MKNILIILILLTSCESQRAGRKTKWLKDKGYLTTDTIYRSDTIRGFTFDTVVQFDTLNRLDTLTVEKNGVKVVTVTRWLDRWQTQTITKRDTILTTPQQVTTIQQRCGHTWWTNFWVHFLIGVAFVLLILLTFVWVLKTLE